MEIHKKIVEDEQTENLQEEAVSLCDFAIKEESRQAKKETPEEYKSTQEEFDFCSFSKETEMCSADQVFFQGQILPLHHSLSLLSSRSNSTTTSGGSSRSSSIRSHQSSSTSTTTGYGSGASLSTPIYKPSVPNNFNSHPSPKPKTKISRIRNQNMRNCSKKSTVWSLFRLGLVTTPELALDDLKHRSRNNTNKSFQKSKSSGSNNSENSTRFISLKKKKQGIFEVNGILFGTCKCSSNAVDTIPSRIGRTTRSVREKDDFLHEEGKGTKKQQEGKQSISRNRTFEWLRQLSLDSTSNITNDA